MVSQLRSKETLELGIHLVAQLERQDDLLAAWMAHYIAELIDNVEKTSPEDKRSSSGSLCQGDSRTLEAAGIVPRQGAALA